MRWWKLNNNDRMMCWSKHKKNDSKKKMKQRRRLKKEKRGTALNQKIKCIQTMLKYAKPEKLEVPKCYATYTLEIERLVNVGVVFDFNGFVVLSY
jgi:hypothetical protein